MFSAIQFIILSILFSICCQQYDDMDKPLTFQNPTNVSNIEIHKSKIAHEFEMICKNSFRDVKVCNCSEFILTRTNKTLNLCSVMNHAIIHSQDLTRSACHLFQANTICTCQSIRINYLNHVSTMCSRVTPVVGNDQVKGQIKAIIKLLCQHRNITEDECYCHSLDVEIVSSFPLSLVEDVCDILKKEDPIMFVATTEPRYEKSYAIVAILSSVVGIFGNGLVVLMAIKFRENLATCATLIGFLGVIDLSSAITLFIDVLPKLWKREFVYGNAMCKIIVSSESMGSYLAIGVIFNISVERFIGIVNPFRGGLSRKTINWTLSVQIIIGSLAVVPLFIYANSENLIQRCTVVWPGFTFAVGYTSFVLIFYLSIPVLVISFLYVLILKSLNRRIVTVNSLNVGARITQKRIKENNRIVCVLASVVVAFVVLVCPKYIVAVYWASNGWYDVIIDTRDLSGTTYYILYYTAYLSYPTHVAINPIIYSLIDSKWRTNVKKYFRDISKSIRPTSISSSSLH